jgi:biotin carboxylase
MHYYLSKILSPIHLLTLYLMHTTGDKTSAKELAIKANVPIITGSDSTFSTPSEAKEWIEDPSNPITYPVIVKAAMGGGGRGIRIVPTADDLESCSAWLVMRP